MSKYTTEVRYICETLAGQSESVGGDDVDNIIAEARPKLFNFNYPIFDPNYRTALETKILQHYYTREIAHETVGLWKLKLKTKMNEIMPYYNQLYKSELLEFNPFYDTDVSRNKEGEATKTASNTENTTHNSSRNANSKTTNSETSHDSSLVLADESTSTNGTSKNAGTVSDDGNTVNNLTDTTTATNTVDKTVDEEKLDAYSDTPQGTVANLESNAYLTNARKNVNSNEEKETEKINQSLKKTGTVDANNITTTDMTRTDNISGSKNASTDSTNTGSKSGEVNGTNSTTHNSSSGVTGNTNVNDIESYIETVKGKQGNESYSELLQKFRSTFLNIDMLVIDELGELFFNLW